MNVHSESGIQFGPFAKLTGLLAPPKAPVCIRSTEGLLVCNSEKKNNQS